MQEFFRGGRILGFRRNHVAVRRGVFADRHVRVNNRELEEIHVVFDFRRHAIQNELPHQIHGRFALRHERHGFLPAIGGGVVKIIPVFHKLPPIFEGLLHARVGIRHFAEHQIHVIGRAVDAHVQIIEPRRRRPWEFRADGKRRHAVFFQRRADLQQLVPRFRLGQIVLLKNGFAVVNRPPIIGVRQKIGFAVLQADALERFREFLEQPGVLPYIADVHDQAFFHEIHSAVSGKPGDDIRRIIGRQPEADGFFEFFMGGGVQFDLNIRVRFLKFLDDFRKGFLRQRIAVHAVNHQFFGRRERHAHQ